MTIDSDIPRSYNPGMATKEEGDVMAVRGTGLMTSYDLVAWIKSKKYHIMNRIVIEPRLGGLIEVYQYDHNGDELES